MGIKCDSKSCDEKALPCDAANQIIFSLNCEVKGLKKDADNGIIDGVIVALQVLRQFDSPTIALEIICAVGGFKTIHRRVKETNNACDKETLAWLVKNGAKNHE